MSYDLVVRNGTVVDGSGLPRFRADVGVVSGKIAKIGRITGKGEQEIDAEGHVVTPGFVDGHTHMDAQIAWDPLGTCSCWHGITTVVMGNCGFTLAPARATERELVVRNLERAEDISAEAMAEGINWTWETFPEYLDTLERLPKGINYSGYVGHSALRTWAMGERAFEEAGNEADLAVMAAELRASMKAGALGFTTSRTFNHQTSDDRPVASRLASWGEVESLVRVMGDMGGGIFEIAGEDVGRDPEKQADYYGRLRRLAVETGIPVTFGVASGRKPQGEHLAMLDLLDSTAAQGGRMFGQAHAREFNVVLSFKTQIPFDALSEWKEFRGWPLDEQLRALRDPSMREKLLAAARDGSWPKGVGAEARKPDYDWIRVMDAPMPPYRSVAEVARERGVDPAQCMIDLAVESNFEQFFLQPILNGDQDIVLDIMRHPRCVVTFSDSGAHVSQLMDSSIQTHLLGHWTRERQAFTLEEAVRMLTLEPSTAWGFHDRGLVREGMAADLVVFDPDRVGPGMPQVAWDLPGGATRLVQKASGIAATVVNGQVLIRNGEHTGAYPGQLIRGPLYEG
ncbi:MAG: amidohydrolase family protein [Acidimicrobiia bacterium]|nr:amidohydrolase family protein [Acidimicrobiia bacterium]MDH4363039.1 amidohydrolase family protein [Acidimicrobiia bacterium]MDH5288527.1 amidohydrolase family protein [Acidimicrobiia bacterium]